MKRNYVIMLLLTGIGILMACKPTATTTDENTFGAGVNNPESAVSFAEVSQQLDAADSLRVILRAKVSEVCQAKGCWMNIVDPASGSEDALFVQFKDYGFFVPKDIAGREVILEGVAYKEETSVEELRHYAEDAGKSEEEIAAITAPALEKKFMATGVILVK